MDRKEILRKLRESITKKEPLVGVAIGNGYSARQARDGGADMLAALNAGRFRMSGVASTASFLPFRNCNDLVFDFATTEVLPQIKDIPVLFGACAQDPRIKYSEFIDKLIKAGFHGINNFPTVSLIDGFFRTALEEEGNGFIHEVNLLRTASDKNMFTVAFVVTLEEAIMMAQANVDVICLHFGWTNIKLPPEEEMKSRIDNLIHRSNVIVHEVKKIKPDMITMIYGGSIVQNQTVIKRFYEETDIKGYFGGSIFDTFPVKGSIQSATELFKNMNRVTLLQMENENLRKLLKKREGIKSVLGNSQEIADLITWIEKVSNHEANILIEGESGTGKDLVAKVIHYNSNRATGPFKKVNCASVSKQSINNDLFGSNRRNIDGASSYNAGWFESADHGTLFLDNVSELDMETQAKLLSVIQDGEFECVDHSEIIRVDVRIISATNKNLKEEMMQGRFREDLYYLLTVLNRRLPPLRDHKGDIPLYVSLFLKQICERHHVNVELTENAMNALMAYDWPGNIRELKNVLERAVILCDDNIIDLTCLPSFFSTKIDMDPSVNYIKNSSMLVEKELIHSEMLKNKWNQTRVATKLGISRRTLYNKLKKYNIHK